MDIALVCVPYAADVARWGAAQGPASIVDAGLVTALESAGHQVDAPIWIELPRAERTRDIVTNLGRIAARTSDAVSSTLREGRLVIVLEGDCTHAVGAAGGLARVAGDIGVVWFDAHGDMNTMQTTQTGLWAGMPYAVILGWDLDDWRKAAGLTSPAPARAAALVGGSDLDTAEIDVLERHDIARLDAREMMDDDAGARLTRLLHPMTTGAQAWYLHVDVDVAGPEESPGGYTPAPHWPPRASLLQAAAATADTVPVRVVGLAAYNPNGDPERRGARFAIDMALAVVDRCAQFSVHSKVAGG